VPLRVPVAGRCEPACRACQACPNELTAPSAQEVLEAAQGRPSLTLGGGDALTWRGLEPLLAAPGRPATVWVEVPARSVTAAALEPLRRRGAHGVVVQIGHPRDLQPDPLAAAEAAGLAVRVRLAVHPGTFRAVVPLARQLDAYPVALEVARALPGRRPGPIPAAALEETLLRAPNLAFAGDRLPDRGYLPPCVMPRAWRQRPEAWRDVLGPDLPPNETLSACARCWLRTRCGWRDRGALRPAARRAAEPIPAPEAPAPGQAAHRRTRSTYPAHIGPPPGTPPVICTRPWTTLEITDPLGAVRPCCTEWTTANLGNCRQDTLLDIWNGQPAQEARRVMASGASSPALCYPVCPHLTDGAHHERSFHILAGSPAFMDNQRALAADIAARRAVATGRPLSLTLATSNRCNYDCIMCSVPGKPRSDLPPRIWEDVEELLPTLRNLTLTGGEPLVARGVIDFLTRFDRRRTPDTSVDLITNGSLLTEHNLRRFRGVRFGEITVSVNAGTAEVYRTVQRGRPFAELLANLRALAAFRRAAPEPLGLQPSFVVQPANAHTLIPFGELVEEQGADLRLLALSYIGRGSADLFDDPSALTTVERELDRFGAWCRHRDRPRWAAEAARVRRLLREGVTLRQSLPPGERDVHAGQSVPRPREDTNGRA